MKQKLSLIWGWLRKWWWTVLLLIGTLTLFLVGNRARGMYRALLKKYKEQQKDYESQLRDLDALRQKERVRLDEVQRDYEETLRKLEETNREAREALSRKQEKELRDLIEETRDDPGKMAQKVNEMFGIEVFRSDR